MKRSQHLDRGILRPVTPTAMHLSSGAPAFGGPDAQYGAEALRVVAGASKAHAETRFSREIPVQPGLGPILSHRQVHTAVAVKIANHGPKPNFRRGLTNTISVVPKQLKVLQSKSW